MRLLVSVSAVLLVASCAPSPIGSGPCVSTTDCPAGEVCIDGRCISTTDGGGPLPDGAIDPRTVVGLEIAPVDPLISSTGTPMTVDLELLARLEDGSTMPVTSGATFSAPPSIVGAVARSSGVFTAYGVAAGSVVVTGEAFSMTATTTVRVELELTIIGEGAPSDAPTRFGGAMLSDPARDAGLLYPLDGTVFPANVFPADLQWERGAAGDLYRITLAAPGIRVVAYVIHSGDAFTYHWLVDRAAWRALAESAIETDVSLQVDRLDAATSEVIVGAARRFRFAEAIIRGAIYYWDLGGGRILRIRGDGTGLEAFMPSPPPRADGARCIACHTVSRDGSRMAAELWEGGDFGAVFDLRADLTTDPPPMLVPPDRERFLFSTFDPTNARLLANNGNTLFLLDANTGGRVATAGTPLPGAGAAQPTWSPDGAAVAYVSNTNGGWAVDFTQGDLSLIDVPAPDTFGAPRTIFPGAPLVVARPTWSPDSAFVAFQHGQHSRAFEDPGGGAPSIRRDATVRMVSRDGATVFDLGALNGGASNSYYPTFSPFDEGGYFWLAFFSTRDYGNAQAGTRGTGRRQLWVAAVSSSPAAGTDPSRVPYWLPQQDVSHQNMAAFWAEEPCHPDGSACATSGECCSGFCRDLGSGAMCTPPDDVPCSMVGEACREDADCCEGAGACLAGTCTVLM